MLTIPVYKGRNGFAKLLVYFGCLYFCVYYLHELFAKQFRTYFELTLVPSDFRFLSICISLNATDLNRRQIEEFYEKNLTTVGESNELDDETLNECRNYTELLLYYGDRSMDKTPKQILDKARHLQMQNSFSLEPAPKEKPSFYLNSGSLCLRYPLTNVTILGGNKFIVYNNYKLTNRVFFHGARYAYDYHNHFHIQMCQTFRNCEEFEFYSAQFFFNFTKPPFGTRCIEHNKTNFAFGGFETLDHESACKQACIKAAYHTADYFYSDRDDQQLNFTRINLPEVETKERQCNEKCNEKCKRKECQQTTYLVESKNMFIGNHTVYNLHPMSALATETPYIGEFDFQLNLIGFVSLLFGVSLSLAISNIQLLVNFKTNFRFTRLCYCASYFVLLWLNAYVFLKTYDLISDYLHQSKDPQYSRRLFEFHDMDLHVCFPLAIVFNYSFEDPDNYSAIRERTKEILANRKLEEMQSLSLPPQELIARIYYNYRKEQNHFDVSRTSDFAFLNSNYGTEKPIYSKCFTYQISKLVEPNYRTLMRESRLVVQSKGQRFNVFLTEKSKRLTSRSVQIHMGVVELVISEYSDGEDGCVDYEERLDFDCDSQEGCITNCVLEEFAGENRGLLPPVVVDSKNFRKYKQHNYDLSKESRGMEIRKECEKQFTQEDCYSASYMPQSGGKWMPFEKNKWEIFLYFLIRHKQTGIKKPLLATLVDVTTMYCILIGLSYPQLVGLCYKLILEKSALFYRFHKSAGRYMRMLRRLVTLAFFLYYLRIVLNDSLNTVVESTYVEESLTELMFPIFGLCFKIESKRSLNHLTDYQLQAKASHITVDSVLELISYISNTTKDMVDRRPGQQFDSNFQVTEMFYQTRKCLEFRYKLNVKDPRFNRHNYGLRMKLNKSLNYRYPQYYYYTRSNIHGPFSRFYPMKLDQFYNLHFTIEKVRYHDSFQTLKNPLRLFMTASEIRDSGYLEHLKRDFKQKYNASTLLLPLYPESFGLKVRNDLFEQYVDEVVTRRERYAVDYNFDEDYCVDFISTTFNRSYELSFSKRIPVVIQKTESSCTFVTFFTNLLNLITFWFDLSVTQCLQGAIERLYMAIGQIVKWIVLLVKRWKV